MRKQRVLTALAIAAFTAAPTAAQTFGLGAHAGVSLPTGEYNDVAGTGFLGGLDLWYPLTMAAPGLSWYTSVDAIAHGAETSGADGGYLFVPVMTGLRFDGGLGPLTAFIAAQLGLVLSQGPERNGVDSDLGTGFGFNVGAGLQFTEYIYSGVRYFPLGDVTFEYDGGTNVDRGVSFVDIYLGFGVR